MGRMKMRMECNGRGEDLSCGMEVAASSAPILASGKKGKREAEKPIEKPIAKKQKKKVEEALVTRNAKNPKKAAPPPPPKRKPLFSSVEDTLEESSSDEELIATPVVPVKKAEASRIKQETSLPEDDSSSGEEEDIEDMEGWEEDEEDGDSQEKEDDEEDGDSQEEEDDEVGVGGIGNKLVGEEFEKLEKEYQNIRNEQQSLLNNLKRHKDDDILKGQAVKNQKALWNKSLEIRFLLQKAFSSSNKLPLETIRSSFCDYDESIHQAYSDLISSSKQTLNCLLELQKTLIEKNPAIPSATDDFSNNVEFQDDEEWLEIHAMISRIVPFRNCSVDKWHRKTQVATGAAAFKGKLHTFNQNISEQVAAFLRDPSRMVKRMQLRSSTVGLLGVDDEKTAAREEEGVDADGSSPELIDDSEFYQQLLKEFFESCNLLSSETAFYAMKKLQPKKRKMVDRRASKSRKIRYNVHEKIANFMAPKKMHLPLMAPKLFENLFGIRNQNSASVL